ncbi:MAG TPA: EcsC family protein [Thermodesulfobacteriota bacterium]|nr:EcsC family protein [Thermodesulfobacteriota bacterium]
MNISRHDLKQLRYAKSLLENPSLAAKITNYIGMPIEKAFRMLPPRWSDTVNQVTRISLQKALDFAVKTIDDGASPKYSNRIHKMIVAVTGAAGGAFGLASLAVELPISTTVMLRSIADVARSEGEQIKLPEVKLACLEVFALGGRSKKDDATETGYLAVRAALSRAVSDAVEHISRHGLVHQGSSAIVRFIAEVASRFGINVSEKVAAQAVPVLGAAGGALINTIFIDHFQDIARGHFIVRRLERKYGAELVKEEYLRL